MVSNETIGHEWVILGFLLKSAQIFEEKKRTYVKAASVGKNTNYEFECLSKYPDLRQLWYIRSAFVREVISDININLLESMGKSELFSFHTTMGVFV